MMMNNNQMINQMLQMIQKNNEEIIQMIQQIFQIQMLNNMILNQILNNNLNSNNNNFIDILNQNNNTMNNNFNMQNMINNNMMNMMNNNNDVDPWAHIDISKRIYILFKLSSGKTYTLHVPKNITENELIEGFIKKSKIGGQNIRFTFNSYRLKKDGCRKLSEIGKSAFTPGAIVLVDDS